MAKADGHKPLQFCVGLTQKPDHCSDIWPKSARETMTLSLNVGTASAEHLAGDATPYYVLS